MNVFHVIALLYAHHATTICAYLLRPRLLRKNVLREYAQQQSTGADDPGDPLFLTPLLDNGRIDEARNLALVQPPLGDIVSFTGFLTVNRSTKSHLFFWFIPRTTVVNTPSPLILWLQGGPGCSSLYGLFCENGPFEVTKDGLQRREYAWTNEFHMLYIDQPVGTGFSFTEDENNGYISTQEEVAEYLYEALVQFYQLFPEMLNRDFYIAGESYAGKYIPALGHKIHIATREPDALGIPLAGMMIGNGYSDPLRMLQYSEYLYGVGLIDRSDRERLEVTEDEIQFLIQSQQWILAVELFNGLEQDIISALNFTNLYNYAQENDFETESLYINFLTQNHIRNRIHVGRVKFEESSMRVFSQFDLDYLQSVRPLVQELLEHYPMVFFNGQFDIVVPHTHSENFLINLEWSGAYKYGHATRRVWRVDDTVAGYYKSGGNLVNVLVRNAGHMVSMDRPKNALVLIRLFVDQKFHDNWHANPVNMRINIKF